MAILSRCHVFIVTSWLCWCRKRALIVFTTACTSLLCSCLVTVVHMTDAEALGTSSWWPLIKCSLYLSHKLHTLLHCGALGASKMQAVMLCISQRLVACLQCS